MKKLLYVLLPFFAANAYAQQPYVSNGPRGGQARVLTSFSGQTLAGGRGNLYQRQNGAWNPLSPSWNNVLSCESFVSLNATVGGMIAGTLNAGIFFSSDNGVTWSNITGDIRTGSPYRSVAYANMNYLAVRSDGGLYSSSDGITWIQRNFSLGNAAVGYLSINNNQIYATTNNGLYKSGDNGLTFTLQNPGMGLDGKMTWVNNVLWIAGSTGLSVSTDDGISFGPVMLNGRTVGSVAVDGNNVLATVAGPTRVDSIVYSSNGGSTFSTVLPNASIRYTTVFDMSTDGTRFYVGTDRGILSANVNNTGWRSDDSGYHALQVTHLGSGGGQVYATATGDGSFNTSDSGASWTAGASAYNGAENTINATDGYNQFAYAAGATNFYRSTNGGLSYTAGATGLSGGSFSSVCVQKSNGAVLVIRNGELFRSGDNGLTFAQVVTGIPAGIARKIYRADTSWFITAANDSLYQGGSNYQFVASSGIQGNGFTGVTFLGSYFASHSSSGLFTSPNGKTWTAVTDPAVPLNLNAIAEADTALYLGTSNGLVSNKGGSWHADSLQGRIVNALLTVNRKMYAGTCDGIWARKNIPPPPIDTNVGVRTPGSGFATMQLAPNPATGDFNAMFSSNDAGSTTLTMTDVSGRIMYTTRMIANSGSNTVRVPVSAFKPAPGLYFVKIQTASAQGVQRILIQ